MSIDRRSFLKLGGAALASAALVPALVRKAAAADADLPMASEKEEPAKTLKYCASADKPTANCAARKDKAKASQYCYNCQLFTKLAGDQKGATGKCMIMPKNRVSGGAWCQSWVKSPA